jgi:Tol biopolymer transport system component
MTTRLFACLLALGATVIGCSDATGSGPDLGPLKYDLLYEGTAGGTPTLFLIDTAGGHAPRPLLPPGTIGMDPSASADGSRVAFVVADYVEGTGDIFVIGDNGTAVRQLTNDSELDDSPAWSPDGKRIAFRSYRSGYDGEIWVVNTDGTAPVNLTPNALPATWDNRHPSWSPDGRSIVFASTLGGDFGIWVMNADGSGKRQLTNTPALDAEPEWSPDGRSIAFRRTDATGSDIMIVPAAGGEATRIAMPGDQRMPAWSPDGKLIAFVGQETAGAQPELFLMRADGQQVRRVTTDPAWGGGIHPSGRGHF